MMETDGWDGPEWSTWKGTLAKVVFILTLFWVMFVVGSILG